MMPPHRLTLGEDVSEVVSQVALGIEALFLCLCLVDGIEESIEAARAHGFAFLPVWIDSLEECYLEWLKVRIEYEGG